MALEREMLRELRDVRSIMERAQRWSVTGLRAPFSVLWGAVILGGGLGTLLAPESTRGFVLWPLVAVGAAGGIVLGATLGPRASVREGLWWRQPVHWALVAAVALSLPHLLELGWSPEGVLLLGLVVALGYSLEALWSFPPAAAVGAAVAAAGIATHAASPKELPAATAIAWGAALLTSGLLLARRRGWR